MSSANPPEHQHQAEDIWRTDMLTGQMPDYLGMMLTGFSPRKPALVLYGLGGGEQREALLEKLGKFKTGKGCLYIKKLEDVHLPTLKKLIALGVKEAKKKDRPQKSA